MSSNEGSGLLLKLTTPPAHVGSQHLQRGHREQTLEKGGPCLHPGST